LSRVVEYPLFEYIADEKSSFVCRRCRQRSPSKRATRACGTRWGNRLEAEVQPPTVEELLAQLERQPPAPEESRGPVAATVEKVVTSGAEGEGAPAAAVVEEAVAAEAEEETPVEGGLVDIASILGAPAVTIVRSSL
jgi:hypothetical protein